MSILSEIAQHLEPGEVLDDLIARFVMRWHGVSVIPSAPEPTWMSLSGQIQSPVMPCSEWRPSVDPVQALRVLAACERGLSRDAINELSGTAIRTMGSSHWEIALSEDMVGTRESIWAPTFPLAVCRAAVATALWKEVATDILDRRRPSPEFVPIIVPGKPVSEQIIEDRR